MHLLYSSTVRILFSHLPIINKHLNMYILQSIVETNVSRRTTTTKATITKTTNALALLSICMWMCM